MWFYILQGALHTDLHLVGNSNNAHVSLMNIWPDDTRDSRLKMSLNLKEFETIITGTMTHPNKFHHIKKESEIESSFITRTLQTQF